MKLGEGEVGKSKAFPSLSIVLVQLHLRHFQAYIITEMSVTLSSSQQSGATSTKPSIPQAPRPTALHCHRSILTKSHSPPPFAHSFLIASSPLSLPPSSSMTPQTHRPPHTSTLTNDLSPKRYGRTQGLEDPYHRSNPPTNLQAAAPSSPTPASSSSPRAPSLFRLASPFSHPNPSHFPHRTYTHATSASPRPSMAGWWYCHRCNNLNNPALYGGRCLCGHGRCESCRAAQ